MTPKKIMCFSTNLIPIYKDACYKTTTEQSWGYGRSSAIWNVCIKSEHLFKRYVPAQAEPEAKITHEILHAVLHRRSEFVLILVFWSQHLLICFCALAMLCPPDFPNSLGELIQGRGLKFPLLTACELPLGFSENSSIKMCLVRTRHRCCREVNGTHERRQN